MTTGRRAASAAGRQLASKGSTGAERRVAASDLAQARAKSGRRTGRNSGRKSGR